MKRPKFDNLISLMKKGKNFELSNEQYLRKTGAEFPKRKSYAEKNSAVSACAKQYGYVVTVIPQKILFTRIENK